MSPKAIKTKPGGLRRHHFSIANTFRHLKTSRLTRFVAPGRYYRSIQDGFGDKRSSYEPLQGEPADDEDALSDKSKPSLEFSRIQNSQPAGDGAEEEAVNSGNETCAESSAHRSGVPDTSNETKKTVVRRRPAGPARIPCVKSTNDTLDFSGSDQLLTPNCTVRAAVPVIVPTLKKPWSAKPSAFVRLRARVKGSVQVQHATRAIPFSIERSCHRGCCLVVFDYSSLDYFISLRSGNAEAPLKDDECERLDQDSIVDHDVIARNLADARAALGIKERKRCACGCRMDS